MDRLIGVAAEVYPDILKLVATDKSATLGARVAKAVAEATATRTAQDARTKLDRDPAAASDLRTRLAQIAFQAYGAEAGAADSAPILAILSKLDKPSAWTPSVISYIVSIGFLTIVILLMTGVMKPAPTTSGGEVNVIQLVNVCVGALATAFATVVNFWLGSSLGSRNKDAAIAQSTAVAQAKTLSENVSAPAKDGQVGDAGWDDDPAPRTDRAGPGPASRALANQF
jgi:hypothetical protein